MTRAFSPYRSSETETYGMTTGSYETRFGVFNLARRSRFAGSAAAFLLHAGNSATFLRHVLSAGIFSAAPLFIADAFILYDKGGNGVFDAR